MTSLLNSGGTVSDNRARTRLHGSRQAPYARAGKTCALVDFLSEFFHIRFGLRLATIGDLYSPFFHNISTRCGETLSVWNHGGMQ